jgi:hypothetical protein
MAAQAASEREVCLMLDAYTTTGDRLMLSAQPMSRAVEHRQIRTAESGRLTLMLDHQPPVRTPLRAVLTPVITDLTRQNGRLTVEGMMEATLLYMTDDEPAPQVFHAEEPFRAVFACEPALAESAALTVTNIDPVTVTSDRVEVKYILHLDCGDVQLSPNSLVTQITAQPSEPCEPGILLCFSRANETVWDLAKRYRVSPEALKRMNPALQDGGAEGQRVVLWKR